MKACLCAKVAQCAPHGTSCIRLLTACDSQQPGCFRGTAWHYTQCRIEKCGLAVSGKSAAKAALEAASQAGPLPSAGKKRKGKPAAGGTEQSDKPGKKRKVGAAAEATPSEAGPEGGKSGSTRRGRPPRAPAEGTPTPSDQGHKLQLKLSSTSEASCSSPTSWSSPWCELQRLHLG